MILRIDKDSRWTVAIVWLGCAAVVSLLFIFVANPWICWPVTALMLWTAGWQTLFHRVPERFSDGSDTLVSAVADGKVVVLEKAFEPEYLRSECLQISVYMDFWDVHANFWPLDGKVSHYEYHPGKHLLAFKPKASLENEHTCTAIRNAAGQEVLFKQLAGGFARRIVCYSREGMEVKAGEQCGIIRFGSRIDYFLPLDAKPLVRLGQTVRACETLIAELANTSK